MNYEIVYEIYHDGYHCSDCGNCFSETEVYDIGDSTQKQSFRYCSVLEEGVGECDPAIDLERERADE